MKGARTHLVLETQDKGLLPHLVQEVTRDNILDTILVKVLSIMTRACIPVSHIIITPNSIPTLTLEEGLPHPLHQDRRRQVSTHDNTPDPILLHHIPVW